MNKVVERNHSLKQSLNQLVEQIHEKHEQPQDFYEVAAILESLGYNDEMVSRNFGFEDVFELSQHLWDLMKSHVNTMNFTAKEEGRSKTSEMIRSFLRGLIFAFPIVVSVASMLTLHYSLWSYENLTISQATAIGIGTVLSFITVGGFTQAIARRGFFYIIQGYYHLARKNTFLFIGSGFLFAFVLCVLFFLFNFIFNLFSNAMMLLTIVFFFFLNAIWLSVTVMYILKKEILFTGLFLFSVAIVFLLFEVVGIGIIWSQIIALSIISICSIIVVLYFFLKEEKKSSKKINLKLPRLSITVYSVAPYFFYGFLYFSFLFIDRVNAWSTNESYMPYPIWFRGPYEFGLDFALLTLIIPMGVSEVIVTKLMDDLQVSQQQYLIGESRYLYDKFLNGYNKMFLFIFVSGIFGGVLVYTATYYYNKLSIYLNDQNLMTNVITQYVMFWGVLSYVILSICLMNAVILFALSQPQMVIRSILPALGLNFIIGFLFSRWFGFQYAVLGMFFGSIWMSVSTTYYVRKVLGKIDYYLYQVS